MTALWKKAQERAKEIYEEEYGKGSWEYADKYEREDYVFTEYERLSVEKENNTMALRDPKTGRFVSITNTSEYGKATNNTTTNKKENDTMMNKTNAKANRMETLKANGIDTTNFFDLSIRIPFGAEVKIVVDGKEMITPATNGNTNGVVRGFDTIFGIPTIVASNGDICNAETGEVMISHISHDPIAQSIMEDGYVKNSHLFRRWITAQTFRMIEYTAWRNPNRKGWEACMKDRFGYEYQFDMMADELHTLAKLQKEDPEYFAERTKFFNGKVAVELLNDYLYRLKKYVNKQTRENPRTYRGEAYVKLAKYGNVLVKDLDTKVYKPIQYGIADVHGAMASGDYNKIEKTFKDFMSNLYNKLPYETPKCATWKDAFKGSGAYYTLQNLIRFHGVILRGASGKYDSEGSLKELLNDDYKNEVWRFHNLLIDTIAYNNFDLKKSIAEGHAAPNTVSTRANVYKR